jgi:adenosylcobinamide-GDP ribazoletransferase
MTGGEPGQSFGGSFKTGIAFCTRLPILHAEPPTGAEVARASWTFPIIGVLIGAFGGFIDWIADGLGLHFFISSVLALAATAFATGCLHEDGLADTIDGFGGGGTRERKLEIMRDSRVGAYAATALMLALMLKVGAIASLEGLALVAAVLIAAHAGARAAMVVFMRLVPAARADGLAADAGRPPAGTALGAGLLGVLVLWLCLGFSTAFVTLLLLAAALALLAWLCIKQIGGQTGDVLGAVEQLSEILILLVAAARL